MDINGLPNVDSLGGTPLNRDNLGLNPGMTLEIRSINQFIYCYPPSWVLGRPVWNPNPAFHPSHTAKTKHCKDVSFAGPLFFDSLLCFNTSRVLQSQPMRGFFSGTWQVSHFSYPFITSETMPWPTTYSTLLKEPVTCLRRNPASTHYPLRFSKCPRFRCVFGIIIPGRDGKWWKVTQLRGWRPLLVKGSFKMAFLLAKISSAWLFCIFPPTLIDLIGLSTSSFVFVLYSAHFLSHFLMLKSRHLLKRETYVVQIIHDDTLWFTQSNHLLATSKKIDYSLDSRL